METVATIWDMAFGAAVVLSGVIGSYWQLKGRMDKEELARESQVTALGKDIASLSDDLSKVAVVAETLRRRDDFRRGKEAAEVSGVEDLPRRRVHPGTDTFTG
jgi:hypothetical protein